jgi:hypothetical protein
VDFLTVLYSQTPMLHIHIGGLVYICHSKLLAVTVCRSDKLFLRCVRKMSFLWLFRFQGGQYLLTVMDWYIGATALIVVGFLEPLIISYIYGKKLSAYRSYEHGGINTSMIWATCRTCPNVDFHVRRNTFDIRYGLPWEVDESENVWGHLLRGPPYE